MEQPQVIHAQHKDFPHYWGCLDSEHLSPYKISSAFAELHGLFGAEAKVTLPREDATTDFSFVIVRDGKPVLGCYLMLQKMAESSLSLGCSGMFASAQIELDEFNSETNNIGSDLCGCLYQYLDSLIEKLQPDRVEFYDSLHSGVMSPVSHWLLINGAVPVLFSTQRINLSGSLESLALDLSETHQAAIRWGDGNLTYRTINSSEDLESEIRMSAKPKQGLAISKVNHLYYRSLLDSRKAYIVQAFFEDSLVASASFAVSNGESRYIASLTSDKNCPNSVLQGLLWQGLIHGKSLGLNWAELSSSVTDAYGLDLDVAGFGGVSESRFKLLLNPSR